VGRKRWAVGENVGRGGKARGKNRARKKNPLATVKQSRNGCNLMFQVFLSICYGQKKKKKDGRGKQDKKGVWRILQPGE